MRRLLAVLPFLMGCADGLFGPSAEEIDIELERTAISETTLLVGQSVMLTARATGSGSSVVSWQSRAPEIARVDGDGSVHGVAVGETSVIASAGRLADTVFISVLAAPPPQGYCAAGGGVQLARGESLTTTAQAAKQLCIQGGANNQIYVLAPFHAATSGSEIRVEVAANGVGNGSISLQPDPPARSLVSPPYIAAPREFDPEAHRLLREREARDLTPLIRGTGPLFPSTATLAALPNVGDELTLNVNPVVTCANPAERRVRVAAVSDRAVILHETLNPAGGFTNEEYQAFAEAFDDLVYPTVVHNFGEPTDIDGNGRILIVFTAAVNELTGEGAQEYTAGFFYARDLFPRKDTPPLAGCAASNEAELLYLMTPDPSGVINRNVWPKSSVANRTVRVLAHELQHLINASRRLRLVGGDEWSEELWLNEGLSHIAEELTFYAASGLSPRHELSGPALRGSGLAAFERYQGVNASRYASYLRNPAVASPIHGTDLENRGASWAFLRYAADRAAPESEANLWRRIVDSKAVGYANLASALGVSPLAWMHDWAVSLYTDDFIPVDARFRQLSWNFRSVLPTLASGVSGYPLKIDHLRDTSPRYEGTLVPGGTALIRFSIPAEGSVRLDTSSGGKTPPADLRLTLIRTW